MTAIPMQGGLGCVIVTSYYPERSVQAYVKFEDGLAIAELTPIDISLFPEGAFEAGRPLMFFNRINVPHRYRYKTVGTRLLRVILSLANKHDFDILNHVSAYPDGMPQETLIAWYKKYGFVEKDIDGLLYYFYRAKQSTKGAAMNTLEQTLNTPDLPQPDVLAIGDEVAYIDVPERKYRFRSHLLGKSTSITVARLTEAGTVMYCTKEGGWFERGCFKLTAHATAESVEKLAKFMFGKITPIDELSNELFPDWDEGGEQITNPFGR